MHAPRREAERLSAETEQFLDWPPLALSLPLKTPSPAVNILQTYSPCYPKS